ncbi:MAG TPA: hypothetical protein PLB64_07535 [Kiritimatiellia bacterium]|nr:hypothetical protein [Kiritimatiellia bacterium]
MNRAVRHILRVLILPGLALGFSAGCTSLPASARRDALYNQQQYPEIRELAVDDLAILGQYDRAGCVAGTVTAGGQVFDSQYYDMAEEVRSLTPQAYFDMARVSLDMGRYLDAIRAAQNAIESGAMFLGDDEWVFQRMMSLRENHNILYKAYLYCGDLDKAAVHHRQYLLMNELVNSQAFKKVMANSLRIRMTSMRLRSDYQARRAGANRNQVLIAAATVAAAAAASQNNSSFKPAQAAQLAQIGVMAVALLEEYKQALKLEHNLDWPS